MLGEIKELIQGHQDMKDKKRNTSHEPFPGEVNDTMGEQN